LPGESLAKSYDRTLTANPELYRQYRSSSYQKQWPRAIAEWHAAVERDMRKYGHDREMTERLLSKSNVTLYAKARLCGLPEV
jgi:hypothetical protein